MTDDGNGQLPWCIPGWTTATACCCMGIPAHLMRRLQSVLNAAARLIFILKRSDHITDALVSLLWLRVPERIQYKIAVLSYKSFTIPRRDTWDHSLVLLTYLIDEHSALPAPIACMKVPYFKLSTIGGRAFPVAASQIWNSLLDTVVSTSTLRSFRHQLKTFFISTILYLLAL